jgi:hypothetical protein
MISSISNFSFRRVLPLNADLQRRSLNTRIIAENKSVVIKPYLKDNNTINAYLQNQSEMDREYILIGLAAVSKLDLIKWFATESPPQHLGYAFWDHPN